MRTNVFGLLLVVSFSNTGFGQSILLEQKFVVGDVSRYKFTETANIQLTWLKDSTVVGYLERYVSERVESVAPSGLATIIYTQDSVADMEGKKRLPYSNEDILNRVPLRLTMTKSGKVLELESVNPVSGETAKAVDRLRTGLLGNPALPRSAVRPTDSWNDQMSMVGESPLGLLTMIVNMTSTFTGFEKAQGYDCVVIRKNGNLSGSLLKNELKLTGTVTGYSLFADKEGKEIKDALDVSATMDILIKDARFPMVFKISVMRDLLR